MPPWMPAWRLEGATYNSHISNLYSCFAGIVSLPERPAPRGEVALCGWAYQFLRSLVQSLLSPKS